MKSFRAWAAGLPTVRLWSLWFLLALGAAILFSVLPSPWSWIAITPILLAGAIMFDAHSKRDG